MEKLNIEIYNKLPLFGFLNRKQEATIDFQNMKIITKEGFDDIKIEKPRFFDLFMMRYFIPILIVFTILQIGLDGFGVFLGALLYLLLSQISGFLNGTKYQNAIVSVFALPIPIFMIDMSINSDAVGFDVFAFQGALMGTMAVLLLGEFLLIDVIYKKWNDIYRTQSKANWIIIEKESKTKLLVLQKVIVFLITISIVIFSMQNLAAQKAQTLILSQKNAQAKALSVAKNAQAIADKREKVCHELDKKLASDFKEFENEIGFYAKHWENQNILDYEILNINQSTQLMSLSTGKIHTLPLFKSGHFMETDYITVKSDLGRDFIIQKKGHFGIVKTLIDRNKNIAGNYYHVHDRGEEFAIIEHQVDKFALSRIDRKNLLKD